MCNTDAAKKLRGCEQFKTEQTGRPKTARHARIAPLRLVCARLNINDALTLQATGTEAEFRAYWLRGDGERGAVVKAC
jgi:uncharacterized lipoprotein YddW (UPF0748 family)